MTISCLEERIFLVLGKILKQADVLVDFVYVFLENKDQYSADGFQKIKEQLMTELLILWQGITKSKIPKIQTQKSLNRKKQVLQNIEHALHALKTA